MVQEHFGSQAFINCPSLGNHRIQRNDATRILVVDSWASTFSAMQYQALALLIREVYGDESYVGGSENLEKLIRKVRRKLNPMGLTIVNVEKRGYILLAIPE